MCFLYTLKCVLHDWIFNRTVTDYRGTYVNVLWPHCDLISLNTSRGGQGCFVTTMIPNLNANTFPIHIQLCSRITFTKQKPNKHKQTNKQTNKQENAEYKVSPQPSSSAWQSLIGLTSLHPAKTTTEIKAAT